MRRTGRTHRAIHTTSVRSFRSKKLRWEPRLEDDRYSKVVAIISPDGVRTIKDWESENKKRLLEAFANRPVQSGRGKRAR